MNRNHFGVSFLALAAVVAAIAAPAAAARPVDDVGLGVQSASSPTVAGASASQVPATPSSQANVVQVPSDSGFDWGDGAIGAGAALAIAMIGLGAAIAATHHRQRQGSLTPSP